MRERNGRGLGKRFLALCLALCMLLALLPASVLAADGAEATSVVQAHDCAGARQVTVSTASNFLSTMRSLSENQSVDVILAPSAVTVEWSITQALSIPSGATIHIHVQEGHTVTLKRSGVTGNLFTVPAGSTLILGNGVLIYQGKDTETAGQAGSYTVEPSGGALIVDGGASWTASDKGVAFFIDENGARIAYSNSGTSVSGALVDNSGTLNIWGGAVLQNNHRSSGSGSAVRMANKLVDSVPVLNLYGGAIRWCATSNIRENGAGAAVYAGNSDASWIDKPAERYAQVNLWGGEISHNANYNSGSNGDGAAVALDAATLNLYGGKITMNCGDSGCAVGGASADGGGVGVRMGDAFLYGGEISQNWTGGFGGGLCLWNADATVAGTAILENTAAFGGGVAIAGANESDEINADSASGSARVNSKLTMTGGTIAYNKAEINTVLSVADIDSGVGGGICAGTSTRPRGSALELKGGTIRQNIAENGGGIGVYAGKVTAVDMSGNAAILNNTAKENGQGIYFTNHGAGDAHTLLTMSGEARVDSNNPVYFENVAEKQVPVSVTGELTSSGAVAIVELASEFWDGTQKNPTYTSNGRTVTLSCASAAEDMQIVAFADGLDIQENKISLDSSEWYLSAQGKTLSLKTFEDTPLYTIRNGTPVTVDGLKYYKIYQNLADATAEAAAGDTLYIFYNTTISTTAEVETGKSLTLLAESTSSASRAAASSGSGRNKTCWLADDNDKVMEGNFLKYVGAGGNQLDNKYQLDGEADIERYNIRNDYTITLSKALRLGESQKDAAVREAAVMVEQGATLEIGQTATAGMGAGSLTFDGNAAYPTEGPLFQTAGNLVFHDGVTIMNHTNYSEAHPGTIEVDGNGVLKLENGVTLKNGVSPVAGAVYVHEGGAFTMAGGAISENTGAMPRYGFIKDTGSQKLDGYDGSYWGQAKYYYGAGAVYSLGAFTMTGGVVSGNRGEYGAVAAMGAGTLELKGGSITGNHALTGTGSEEYDLHITGYTDGALPVRDTSDITTNAGSGGGVYIGGAAQATVGGSISISDNTAVGNGGGIAVDDAIDLTKTITSYRDVADGYEFAPGDAGRIAAKIPVYRANTAAAAIGNVQISDNAAITGNRAIRMGGGIYTANGTQMDVTTASAITNNTALGGGGLATETNADLTVSSTITGNTAEYGGGVYTGAGTTVTLSGSLTDNTAGHGGGAFVDDSAADTGIVSPVSSLRQAGSGETDLPPAVNFSSRAVGSTQLILNGAYVNNNKLTGDGLGVGIYNRGDVVLRARGTGETAVQPYVSVNDRVYLEAGHYITLANGYRPTRQGERDRLTVLSRQLSNGTAIVHAETAAQAAEMLTLLTHGQGASLTQRQPDNTIIEINQNTVYYRKNTSGDTGEDVKADTYAPGSTVVLLDYPFAAVPEGKSFSGWVRYNADGTKYIHSETGAELDLTETNKRLATYRPGAQITMDGDYYFVADYTSTQYTANVVVEKVVIQDKVETTVPADEQAKRVTLRGVSISADGSYGYGMGSRVTVAPEQPGEDWLLQSVEIYEKTDTAGASFEDHGVTGSWEKVAEAELETETLVLAPPTKGDEISVTVKSTGKLKAVKSLKTGTDVQLSADGDLVYTAYPGDIVVKVTYKEPKVSLTMGDGFKGYYDSPHRAQTAMIQRMEADPTNPNVIQNAVLKLLRPDAPAAEGQRGVVSYYGEQYGDELKARAELSKFSAQFLEQTASNPASFTTNLNGLELNYAGSGRRILNGYDLAMKNGAVRFETLNGMVNTEIENLPMSGYRVESGTLKLDAVEINVNEDPVEGDIYYAVKVMDNGNLEVGKGCRLGRVFIHSDPRTSDKEGTDATVLVTDDFNADRTEDDPVATLCMNRWNFENGERQIFRLSDQPDDETGETLKASIGPNIRRLFRLQDVSDSTGVGSGAQTGDEVPQDRKWFIGTDGKLYKKVAEIRSELEGLGDPISGEDLEQYNAQWTDGYPFYGQYTSEYGESRTVKIQAQLMDAYDQPLQTSEGIVSFTVNRVQRTSPDAPAAISRQASGMVGINDSGAAEIDFAHLRTMPANVSNGRYSISASWAGTAQYAPQYAKYWNYNYINPETEDAQEQESITKYAGYVGNTLSSGVWLTVRPRNLADESIIITAMTPESAEYIGEKGLEQGYSSAPAIGQVTHQMENDKDLNVLLGSDARAFYVALTQDRALAVMGEDGTPLVSCTHDGVPSYYLAGENGGKIYYCVGGGIADVLDGTDIEHALMINSAPAGVYRVGLEADTPGTGSNYTGQGEKVQHFTIEPYSSALSISGQNYVNVPHGSNYETLIRQALEDESVPMTVTDRYGNVLDAKANCTYSFMTVSGSARLDANGWPASEGLYNLVVSADTTQGSKLFTDADRQANPNYSKTARGYMAVLITTDPLTMGLVEPEVHVPYTGQLYTDSTVKAYDDGPEEDTEGETAAPAPGKYKVVLTNGAGVVQKTLASSSYRLEIGSPQHMPRDVGTYTMVVTDKTGKYTGIGTLVIEPGAVADITLSETEGVYTGSNHSPAAVVTAQRAGENAELIQNRGYFLHITDGEGSEVTAPVNAGAYTYTADGVGNYVGMDTASYQVKPKQLDNSDCETYGVPEVTVEYPSMLYVREQGISIDYTVFYNGVMLRNSEDYTVKLSGPGREGDETNFDIHEPGEYTVTLTGKGNFAGEYSFKVMLVQPVDETHKLYVSNTGEFVYSGVNFQGYNWAATAMVEWDQTSRQEDTSRTNARSSALDISRFDITLADAEGNSVPENQVLDAGVYVVTATAQEDYQLELGASEPLVGRCIMRIKRRQVTITVDSQEKTYGTQDNIQLAYSTDIHVSTANGFYAHDRDQVQGSFDRNGGEGVQLGGYRYTVGSFTAGDNYVLLMNMGTAYTILPKDITNAGDVALQTNGSSYAYTGYAPDVVSGATYRSALGNLALGENAQYQLTYEQKVPGEDGNDTWVPLSLAPADVGDYRVTADCDLSTLSPNNYVGNQTFNYSISNTALTLNVQLDDGSEVTYDGAEHVPNVMVTTPQGNLVNSSYYTVTYAYQETSGKTTTGKFELGETAFTNAGVCTLNVVGTGNYAGARGEATFTIRPKDIADEAVVNIALTPADKTYVYSGEPIRADVTASYTPAAGTTLPMTAEDYSLSYTSHAQAGTATVTVTGKGNYTGNRQLTYEIQKKPITIEINSSTLTKVYGAVDPAYTYNVASGEQIKVFGAITRADAGTPDGEQVGKHDLDISGLSAGENYALQLTEGEAPALTITQKPIAKEDGTPSENISIAVPSSVAAEGGITVEELTNRIQMLYWAPALAQQVLQAGTDYTVRVKNIATDEVVDSGALTSGRYEVTLTGAGNYTGAYSAEITVITAAKMLNLGSGETVIYKPTGHLKSITPMDSEGTPVSGCTVSLTVSDVSGKTETSAITQQPDGSIELKLTDVGTYTLIATKDEDDGYYGTVTFTVQPKNVADADVTVSGVKDTAYDYTGDEVTPEDVKLGFDGVEIAEKTGDTVNFVCTYANNINPSTEDAPAVMTIHGQGNYTGTRTVSYQIGETRYAVRYANSVPGVTGTPPTDDNRYAAGSQITMLAPGMSAERLAFIGWTTVEYTEAITRTGNMPAQYYAQGQSYTVTEADRNPIVLYALWGEDGNGNGTADCVEDTYQLIYSKGSATFGTVPETRRYIAGATVVTEAGSVKLSKYVLLGWTETAPDTGVDHQFNTANAYNSFTGTVYRIGATFRMAAADTTLYPVWGVDDDENGKPDWEKTTQRYVRYSANGGTNEPPGVFVDAEVPEITIAERGNVPNRTGYRFAGWTKAAMEPLTRTAEVSVDETSGAITSVTVGETTTTVYQTGDPYRFDDVSDGMFVTFYALWAEDVNQNNTPDYLENQHEVVFAHVEDNGVTVEPNALPDTMQNKLAGETVSLSRIIPEGVIGGKVATFLGWTDNIEAAKVLYTRTNQPAQSYAPGSNYTLPADLAEDAAVTLYALWGDADFNRAEYTVTAAVAHGRGEVSVNPKTVLDGDDCQITITPEPGYQLLMVMVNGEPRQKLETAFTLKITQNTNIVVSFAQSSFTAELTPKTAAYNGKRQAPVVTARDGDKVLEAKDYTLSVSYNGQTVAWDDAFTSAGTYTVTATGAGTYLGSSRTMTYEITPLSIVVGEPSWENHGYTGTPLAPEVPVTGLDGQMLVPNVDYTVTYKQGNVVLDGAPIEKGAYTAIYTGQGNYAGSQSVNFTITQNTDSITVVVADGGDHVYDGSPYMPEPRVTLGSGEDAVLLEKYVDYTLVYGTDEEPYVDVIPIHVGKYRVTACAQGNYNSDGYASLRITPKTMTDSSAISATVANVVYDGGRQTPTVVVTYTPEPDRVLYLKGAQVANQAAAEQYTGTADYVFYYTNNVDVYTGDTTGSAVPEKAPTVTIIGRGNYCDTIQAHFQIIGKTFTNVGILTAKEYVGKGQTPNLDEIRVVEKDKTLVRSEKGGNGDYYIDRYEAVEGTNAKLDETGLPLNAGTYTVHLRGQGNYEGYVGTATFAVNPARLEKITLKDSAKPYSGEKQTPESNVASVTALVDGNSVALDETDYELRYLEDGFVNAGKYQITAIGHGNFTGAKSVEYEIQQATLRVKPTRLSKVYGEEDQTLTYEAQPGNVTLEGSLTRAAGEAVGTYAFSAATLRDPQGNYKVELAADAGSFEIQAKSITDQSKVEIETRAYDSQDNPLKVGYTGRPYTASPMITYQAGLGQLLLAKDTASQELDYAVTYYAVGGTEPVAAPTEPGIYRVAVQGKGNYTDRCDYYIQIDDKTLGAMWKDGASDQQTYNKGSWNQYIQDNLAVQLADTEYFYSTAGAEDLAAGSFRLDYQKVTESGLTPATEVKDTGAYQITVTAKDTSDTLLTAQINFTVLPKDIADATITAAAISSVTYDGTAKTPAVVLTDGASGEDTVLNEEAYTADYQNNVGAGTAQVVLHGTGNYTGLRTQTFTIQSADRDAANVETQLVTETGETADLEYNGTPRLRDVQVTATVAGVKTTLKENVDYTLSYSGDTVNVTDGGVTLVVTGMGNYTGELGRQTYKITPRTLQSSWLTVVPDTLIHSGTAQKPVLLVRDPILNLLVEGTDYTSPRYSNNVDVGAAAVEITGRGNYTGSADASFNIIANTGGFTVEVLPVHPVQYNGQNQKPDALIVQSNGKELAEGDYTLQYRFNGGVLQDYAGAEFVDAGVYEIVVNGANSYAGASGKAVFIITPGEFMVEEVPDQAYTGVAHTPKPTVLDVSVPEYNTELVEGTDYQLFYNDNVNVGTAIITAVGLNNYAGWNRTVEFDIVGDENNFSVRYDGNGNTSGTAPADRTWYPANELVTVKRTEENFAKDAAIFLGWATKQLQPLTARSQLDGLTVYSAGDSFTIGQDTILYAVWAADKNQNNVPDYDEQITITASAGAGGVISPAGETQWDAGSSAVFTMTPNTGYVFAGALVDGKLVHVSTVNVPTSLKHNSDGTFTYTFANVEASHEIVARYQKGGSETPSDPADSGISETLDTGRHTKYMQGYSGNRFQPDGNITRAEVATIFFRLLRDKNVTITTRFPDVKSSDWFAEAVNTLATMGILKGYTDGTFRPNAPITRAEFTTITARLAYKADTGAVKNFTDVKPGDWFYENVQLNAYYGWVLGYPDNSFRPNRNILRGEATKIVNLMTGRIPDEAAIDSGKGARYRDVGNSARAHWAFYHITEASTDHDYEKSNGKETWKNV